MDTEVQPFPSGLSPALDAELAPPPPWKRWVRWGAIAAVALIVVGYLIFGRGGSGDKKYVTQEVTRGELTVTVTATGNLEPRNQVDIGSELSGTVRSVAVDVNAEVKAGQVLARLDTSRLEAQVLQSQSSLASAEAQVVQSVAGLKEARANYARLQKVRELSGNKLPSQQDMDVAESAVAQAEGQQAAARAAVAQARANLDVVKTDLGKADIRSPINGVVLVRSVEPGATVAASLQAPVLFTLAEDLKKMELHVSVDEADIGSVEVGQEASFTVDAFPNRQFHAKITQVYFASNNTQKSTSGVHQNETDAVVTYEAVLTTDNDELLLRPGMTATAEIVTKRIAEATLVPSRALRFVPEDAHLPGVEGNSQRNLMFSIFPSYQEPWQCPQSNSEMLACAWILQENEPALVFFKRGASDRSTTQVIDIDRLPPTPGMRRIENDEIVVAALRRKLVPGTSVIVSTELSRKPR